MMRGATRWMAAVLSVGGLFAAPVPAAAEGGVGLTRDAPGHMRETMKDRLIPEELPFRVRRRYSTRVYDFAGSIDDVARIDHVLSQLCQRGSFIQKMDGFYWARTPGRRFGVGFSGGANLDNPRGLGQRGEVYFFQDQDARCKVYVAKQAAVMASFTPPEAVRRNLAPTGFPAFPGK